MVYISSFIDCLMALSVISESLHIHKNVFDISWYVAVSLMYVVDLNRWHIFTKYFIFSPKHFFCFARFFELNVSAADIHRSTTSYSLYFFEQRSNPKGKIFYGKVRETDCRTFSQRIHTLIYILPWGFFLGIDVCILILLEFVCKYLYMHISNIEGGAVNNSNKNNFKFCWRKVTTDLNIYYSRRGVESCIVIGK